MIGEQRPLKKDAAEIASEFMGQMNTFADQAKWAEHDRAWKEGVLQLLAKIAHELEIARGHE